MKWGTTLPITDIVVYLLVALGVLVGTSVVVYASLGIHRIKNWNGQPLHWYNYPPILTGFYGICLVCFFGFFNAAMHQTNISLRIILYFLMLISLGGWLWFMMKTYKNRNFGPKLRERREKANKPKF